MNNDIIRRDCVCITVEGDADNVLTVMDKIVTRFTFVGNKLTIEQGTEHTARVCGVIDGRRKKKYRKSTRVNLYDVTDDD